MYIFEGKVAFVTGALGVIGKSYTKYLLQKNVKGIVHVDMQKADLAYEQELDTEYGNNKNLFIQVDVTNKNHLKDAFEKTVKHFGQLDIVINNAGICNEDDYELTLQINFIAVMRGTMLALQEYLPKYKQGPGVIVNTSSISCVLKSPSIPVYALSKHAVAAIGTNYADSPDCLNHDIRILTICPAPVMSDLLAKVYEFHPPGKKRYSDQSYAIAQSADFLGQTLINMIENAPNGAAWIIREGKEPMTVDYETNHNKSWEYLTNE